MDIKENISFLVDNIYKIITMVFVIVGVVISYLGYCLAKRSSNSNELEPIADITKTLENRRSRQFFWFGKKMSDLGQDTNPIKEAMYRAQKFQKEGKIDAAIEEWRNIVKSTEGEDNYIAARAWSAIGDLHNMEDQGEEALSAYTEAINLDKNYAEAYHNRGNTWASLAKDEFARGNEELAFEHYESAVANYSDAIQLKRDYVEAYYCRGLVKGIFGQYEPAIVDYKRAINLRPKYADAYMGIGSIELDFNNYESALDMYNKAVRQKRRDPLVYSNRGNAKAAFGKHEFDRRDLESAYNYYKSALTDYNRAIRLDPNFAIPYSELGALGLFLAEYESVQGDVIAVREHYEQASAACDKAIDLKPKFTQAYANRGNIQKMLGNIEDARADFQTALRLAREEGQVLLEIDIEQQILELNNTQ